MSETKALDRILNWKLNPLANSDNPMITLDDFSEAAAELAQLKKENEYLTNSNAAGFAWKEEAEKLRTELDEARWVIGPFAEAIKTSSGHDPENYVLIQDWRDAEAWLSKFGGAK